jgi:hypothetical protein
MADIQYRIPKLTDSELVKALQSIRDDIADSLQCEVLVIMPRGNPVPVTSPLSKNLEDILQLCSYSLNGGYLRIEFNGLKSVLQIDRIRDSYVDKARILLETRFLEVAPEDQRDIVLAKLISSAIRHLRIVESDAAGAVDPDIGWQRFHQTADTLLSGLATATEQLLVKANEAYQAKVLQLETRHRALEERLSTETEKRRMEHHQSLQARELSLAEKEKDFETRHSRYLSREVHKNQTEKLEGWIENWKLTNTTIYKRLLVHIVSVVTAIAFFSLAVWSFEKSMASLAVAGDVKWWIWLHFTARSVVPLAVSVAISIFYIRWTSEFADRHAREEFLNRKRLLDVGRSYWLLEAVRDAQDQNLTLPAELIRELSKNLFEADVPQSPSQVFKPHEVGSLLLQSLKIKSPDGSEIALAGQGPKKESGRTENISSES